MIATAFIAAHSNSKHMKAEWICYELHIYSYYHSDLLQYLLLY